MIGFTKRAGRASLALALLAAASSARALTNFTVTVLTDEGDSNPADGMCSSTRPDGACTLRAAIEQSNAISDDVLVVFDPSIGVNDDVPNNGAIWTATASHQLTIRSDPAQFPGYSGGPLSMERTLFAVAPGGRLRLENARAAFLTYRNPISPIRGGFIVNEGTLEILDSDFTAVGIDTTAPGGDALGGAIFTSGSLTVDRTVFRGCFARGANLGNIVEGKGGAIAIQGGTVTLRDCRFTENNVDGGFPLSGDGFDGLGGALAIFSSASVLVRACTFDANRADGSPSMQTGGDALGGAIYFAPAFSGSARIVNSTFSGNIAQEGPSMMTTGQGRGGAIYIEDTAGALKLEHCTFAQNTATDLGGAIYGGAGPMPDTTLRGTIVYGNTSGGMGPNFSGQVIDAGVNLFENTSGAVVGGPGTGTIVGMDPMLGPLQYNGGPDPQITLTRAIPSNSPAHDAADGCQFIDMSAIGFDQRGIARPQDATCDIGAYEAEAAPVFALGDASGMFGACPKDGVVNSFDLAKVRELIPGPSQACPSAGAPNPGDPNGLGDCAGLFGSCTLDGAVNAFDLAKVRELLPGPAVPCPGGSFIEGSAQRAASWLDYD